MYVYMYAGESERGVSRQIKPLDCASASLLKWHSCSGTLENLSRLGVHTYVHLVATILSCFLFIQFNRSREF